MKTDANGNVTYTTASGEPISQKKYEELKDKAARIASGEEKPKRGRPKKTVMTESVLVSQHVPARNDIKNAGSLAERIRQKRLNEQQTLHD